MTAQCLLWVISGRPRTPTRALRFHVESGHAATFCCAKLWGFEPLRGCVQPRHNKLKYIVFFGDFRCPVGGNGKSSKKQ